MKSLAIIIPMFNEELNVVNCTRKVISEVRKIDLKIHLIAVNDGSRDNTLSILKSEKKEHGSVLRIVTYKKNKGYGGAIREGIKHADENHFDYILIMDSDLTNDPKYIKNFVEKINEGHDFVKASRYIKGGRAIGVPFYRRAISITGNKIASHLFNVGVKDCTNGFCMVSVKKMKGIKLVENDFSIILEMVHRLKKKNAKFAEIPYSLTTRKKGKSRFSYTPQIFYNYLKYPLKSAFSK